MNDIMKEKRKVLHKISRTAKILFEMYIDDPLDLRTVNQMIMDFIYNPDDEYIFKSFATWKKEGYTIKKGSKAYLLWGQPINNKDDESKEDNNKSSNEENEDNYDNDFYPIAYVFRNDQVIKPIKRTRPKKTEPPKVPEPVKDLPL